jgi:hypothetical protein
MPSDWVLKENQNVLDLRLIEICHQKMGVEVERLTSKQWYPVVREIYAAVEAAGRSKRIDAFNRTYGLLRGITAGCLVFQVGEDSTEIHCVLVFPSE